MKNLKSSISTLIFVFAIVLLGFETNAQHMASLEIENESSNIISIDENATNVKISIHGDYHADHGSNGYVKAQINNNYRYTSHFSAKLTTQIEALIIKELGTPTSGSDSIKKWKKIDGVEIDGLKIFLKSGKVKIIYKYDNAEVMEILENLTKEICKITYRDNCD